jgi:hypothetical protein
MITRSKVVAPVATVVAVVAVAVTASLVQGGGGSHKPRVLRLADSSSSTAATKDAAPTSSGGDYRLVGDLPQGTPADAPAWALPGGPGPAAPVARLADALKVGTPQRAGDGWTAGGLRVTGEPGRAWYYYPCGPDTAVSSDGPVACAVDSGSGSSGSGTVSSGTVVAEPAPATSPGSAPGNSPGTPPDKPAANDPAASPPPPAPPQKTPSQDAVRAAAIPVLEAVGLQDATVKVNVYAGGGSAVVDPAVGDRETFGWTTRVDVDQNGKLVGASGWLASPERADNYPLITARQAFDALPIAPRMLACPVTPEGGCAAPEPAQITGAHLGLTVAQLASGGQVLVPAWLFDVKGSEDPVAGVAVEPKYLGSGDGPGDQPTTDPATGKPTQVDPAPPSRSPLAFDSAFRAKTDNAVVVQYGDSGSCPHTGVTHVAKEDASTVVVLLEADPMDPNTACTADYRAVKVEVALQAPLGTRTVIDGATGKPVAVS